MKAAIKAINANTTVIISNTIFNSTKIDIIFNIRFKTIDIISIFIDIMSKI